MFDVIEELKVMSEMFNLRLEFRGGYVSQLSNESSNYIITAMQGTSSWIVKQGSNRIDLYLNNRKNTVVANGIVCGGDDLKE